MHGPYAHRIPGENREIVQAPSSCGPNELFRLLGASIIEAAVVGGALQLTFSNGDMLTLTDDSDQYESFVITVDGREMVI